MHPRAEERVEKRMPCMIEIQGEQQKATVLNLSRAGLFVQTMITAERGQSVSVVLDSEHADPLDLPTKVVWKQRLAARTHELGGLGLELQLSSVPQRYLDLCDELVPVAKPAPEVGCVPQRYLDLCDELLPVAKPAPEVGSATEEPASGQPYLVRVRLDGSMRSGRFEVDAVSEESAAAAALELAARAMPGQAWEVLDVSLLSRAKAD